MAQQKCNDPKCPFHGHLKTHGRSFIGVVKSAKMKNTVTVEFERPYLIRKYNRYERRYTRLKAHNPECINAQEGQVVEVKECRPLSKTKAFVVTRVIGEMVNEGD